jgi:CHAT domain-containing protein
MRAGSLAIKLLCICLLFSLPMAAQGYSHDEDSLRVEIGELIERAEELIDMTDAKVIDSALTMLDSSKTLTEARFGRNDTLYAKTLYFFSRAYGINGDYDRRESYATEAIEIWEHISGDNRLHIIKGLSLLVDAGLWKADLILAEQSIDRIFQILEIYNGELTPDLMEQKVLAYKDRARVRVMQARMDEGMEDLRIALGLITSEMKNHLRLKASVTYHIGWLLGNKGDMQECEKYLMEAEALAKQAYGPEHRNTVSITHLLAELAMRRGEYDRADSLFSIVLKISEANVGKSHPGLSSIYINKSRILLLRGSTEKALETAQEAVDINKVHSDWPTNTYMGCLAHLGNMALSVGQYERANQSYTELVSIRHTFLKTVFGYASESQKLQYIQKYPPIVMPFINGAIAYSDSATNHNAMNMILAGKGLAIDALASEHAASICSANPVLDSLMAEHKSACSEIAKLAFSGGDRDSETHGKLDSLFKEKNRIETELSQLCSALRFNLSPDSITTSAVAAALPARSILWEFIKYIRLDVDGMWLGYKRLGYSYAAMALSSGNELTVFDLGDARLIDSLTREYHAIMADALQGQLTGRDEGSTDRFNRTSAELYEQLIAPLENTLDSASTIYIASDGMLNLLPFETLAKNGNRYLIDDYQFVYLTSGRDLLKERPDLSGREALVLADPDYMIDPSMLPALASTESSPLFSYRGNSATPECLGSMFSPLPMTKREGRSVAELLRQTGQYDVTYLEMDQAREGALKNLNQPPAVLHIATHGYFCEQAENPYLSNPLLRSGLILAGANRTIGEMNTNINSTEDGILTAMEVSGLNLIGTDLVVLSACQTGIGDVQNGEGVFGLRRAFQHAGAKSVIMSMFAVPDESTTDLMERFYENWLSGQSKSSALRNASLGILNERRANGQSTHPLFWGGFILVGDPE